MAVTKRSRGTPAATLTLRELNRATLARQMLLARERTAPTAVVERLAGLQAQLARPPFVGLWSRLQGFDPRQLTRALVERRIVRAPAMRCTLHLLSTHDYLSFRATLQPVLTRAMQGALGTRVEALDLDSLVAAARSLLRERHRNFAQLRTELAPRFPQADERALGYAVRTQLPVVQVPDSSDWAFPAVADFADAEAWLGRRIDAHDRRQELVLRYLAAFGPASVADLQTWSGLASMKEVIDTLRPKLVRFEDQWARELFDLADAPRPPADTPAPVRFVPEYDNLVLAHADRTRVIAEAHRRHVTLKNLQVRPTFLVDGLVAGTWSVVKQKAAAVLELVPFVRLAPRVRDELADEGEHLLHFVEPSIGRSTVRFGKLE